MESVRELRSRPQLGPATVLAAFAAAALWFATLAAFDGGKLFEIPRDPESFRLLVNGLGRASVTLISTVFACLFIAIPLTANMYTPHTIVLFVTSRTNRIVLTFFVVSAATATWVTRLPDGQRPNVAVAVSFTMVLASLAILLPYLFSVLRFLDPASIIRRVASATVESMQPGFYDMPRAQRDLARRIHILGNVALKAMDRGDRDVAIHAVEALDGCATRYLAFKKRHKAEWFQITPNHFPGFSQTAFDEVVRTRTWVEMEFLLQLSRTFGAALAKVPDVISAIGRTHRHFTVEVSALEEDGPLDLSLRFMNNNLREAVKRRDTHALYDLLYQCRLLGVELWDERPDRVLRMGTHLQYYGRLAAANGIPFAHDLVAYDFGKILTRVGADAESFPALVDRFLAVESAGSGDRGSRLTAGMFKARAIVAATLLARGQGADADAAQRIAASLAGVPSEIVAAARADLLGEPEVLFWEVTDRMENLDYTPPEVRSHLAAVLEGAK